MTALQAAVDRVPGGAVLVDQDDEFAYLALAGRRGLHRAAIREERSGRITLGKIERMVPRRLPDQAQGAASAGDLLRLLVTAQGAAPADPDDDFAPFPKSAWDPPAPPALFSARAPAPGQESARLHLVAAIGGGDADFAAIRPGPWDQPAVETGGDPDYMPTRGLWG